MNTPRLQTERLVLEPVTLAHAPDIQRNLNNWAIIGQLSSRVPWPYPDDGAECFIREVFLPAMAAGTRHAWAITVKSNGPEAIGVLEYRCGADVLDNRGFWLAEPFWGQGLMTEAIVAFQDWVFSDTDTEQIYVCNSVGNPRSRRVKEKTGAVFVEMLEVEHHSGINETERWVVTRESWNAGRPSGLPV